MDGTVSISKLDPKLYNLIANKLDIDAEYDETILEDLLSRVAFTGNVDDLL